MFNQGSTVFLLAAKKNEFKVYRLNCDNTVKSLFIEVFNTSLKENINEYEEISFQLGYQLNDDEIWKIDNFNIPPEIIYALENPVYEKEIVCSKLFRRSPSMSDTIRAQSKHCACATL